jgi:hypothetical protein
VIARNHRLALTPAHRLSPPAKKSRSTVNAPIRWSSRSTSLGVQVVDLHLAVRARLVGAIGEHRKTPCAASRRRVWRCAPRRPYHPAASAATSTRDRRPPPTIWRTDPRRRWSPRRPAPSPARCPARSPKAGPPDRPWHQPDSVPVSSTIRAGHAQ